MISKVGRGSNASGLMYYLMGEGRHQEHVNPQVIGTWDGMPERYIDFKEAHLGRLLDQPLALGRPGRKNHVWHTSLRNDDSDRVLTDEEWVEVVKDVLDNTGIDPMDTESGARWMVVRHDQDHVHIVATLADQVDGSPIYGSNDFIKTRKVCEAWEEKLDITRTGAVGTGQPGLSRAEIERQAAKTEADPNDIKVARRRLAETIRSVKTTANSPEEFFKQLKAKGVMFEPRMSKINEDQITGYSVGWSNDTSDRGGPVFFPAGKVGKDLTWPKIQANFDYETPEDLETIKESPVKRLEILTDELPSGDTAELPEDIAAITDELSRALASSTDALYDGPVTDAVNQFTRAVPEPNHKTPNRTEFGIELRYVAAFYMLQRQPRNDIARLFVAVMMLMERTEDLRRMQGQTAQANVAGQARKQLSALYEEKFEPAETRNAQTDHLRTGLRVRTSDRGNVGTISSVDRSDQTAIITFRSKDGTKAEVEYKMNELTAIKTRKPTQSKPPSPRPVQPIRPNPKRGPTQ